MKRVYFLLFTLLIFLGIAFLPPVASAKKHKFHDNGDGTAVDEDSGHIWMLVDSNSTMTWEQALGFCEGLVYAGCSDWRLPNIKELEDILDLDKHDPALHDLFSSCKHQKHWSSTPVGKSGKAWVIDFKDGGKHHACTTTGIPPNGKPCGVDEVHYVICVSEGCSFDGTPPEIKETIPRDGDTLIPISTQITAVFSEEVNASSIHFLVEDASGGAVDGTITYHDGRVTFTPSTTLLPNTIYTAKILAGLKDLAGNSLETDYQWGFTTEPPQDQGIPTGSVLIEGGANVTNSVQVTLTISATDDSGQVSEMKISNSIEGMDSAPWEPYITTKAWTLSTGDGEKSVYIQFKDPSGNISAIYSDSILLDTEPPIIGIDPVSSPTNQVSQSIGGDVFEEASISVTADTTAHCDQVVVEGNRWSCTLLDLAEGQNNITVTATDAAGNSAAVQALIVVDTTAPTGSISINNGAEYTNTKAVVLYLTASDPGNSGQIWTRYANAGQQWSSWEAFSPQRQWILPSGDGTKTVYVEFKDDAGNSMGTYTDSIILDTVPPEITAQKDLWIINQEPLSISGTIEEGASLNVYGPSGATITATQTGQSWGANISGLPDGQSNITVTATDQAGNVGYYLVTVIKDVQAPSGSFSINNGAMYTSSTTVTLHITAADDTGVANMSFSNDGSNWSPWEPYSPDKTWEIPSGDGKKTVYCMLEDLAGNLSPVISGQITLDTTLPTLTMDSLPPGPTNNPDLTISGSVESGATVSVELPGGMVGPVEYPEAGRWQCSLTLHEGQNLITVTATDSAGNSVSAAESIVLDTIGEVTIDGYTSPTSSSSQTIWGTRESGGQISIVVLTSGAVDQISYPDDTTWNAQISGLSPGWNTIQVTVEDALHNQGQKSVSIYYDNQPPQGSIAINNDATYTSSLSVILNLSATDDSGMVSQLRISNDGVNWTQWEPYADTKSWSLLPKNSPGNQERTVYVQFKDGAGLESNVVSDTIILDTDAPTITIDSLPSPTNNPTVTVSGTRESGASVIVSVTGGWAEPVNTPSDTTWTSVVHLAEGLNTITASATDLAGNTFSASTSVELDTVSEVSIDPVTTPTNQSSQLLTGVREEGSNVTFAADTTATFTGLVYPSATTWAVTVEGLQPGQNNITVNCSDSFNNPGSAQVSIYYDITPPTPVSLSINNGANGTGSLNVILYVSCQDDSGEVEWMRMSNDGVHWSSWTNYRTSASWTLSSGDGEKTVYVQFKDKAGNLSQTISDSIILDTTAPSLTITQFVTPTGIDSQTIGGQVENGATVSVSSLEAQVSNIVVSGTDWYADLQLSTGNNHVVVTARDQYNNTSSTSVVIYLDRECVVGIDPVVTPTNKLQQLVTGTREEGALVSVGVNSGQSQCEISGPGTTWECLVTLSDGQNTVTANSTDTFGNTGIVSASIVVDLVPPQVSITSQIPQLTANSLLTLNGTREDGAIIDVRIPGFSTGQVQYPSSTLWSATILLKEGSNTIEVTAKDPAGNTNTVTAQTTLDTTCWLTWSWVSSPTNKVPLELTGTVEYGADIQFSSIEGASFTPVSISGNTWTTSVNLVEGDNTITVSATDSLGNTNQITRVITLDTTPPQVAITDYPQGVQKNNTIDISGTMEDGATVWLSAPGAVVQSFQYTGPNSWTGTLSNLREGDNIITATARDTAGNTGSASVTVTVDTIADVYINPIQSPRKDPQLTVEGTREEGAQVTVVLNGVDQCSISGPGSTWQCNLTLAEGENTVSAQATDYLGNTGSFQRSVVLDSTAPAPVQVSATDTLLGGTVILDWSSYNATSQGVAYYLVYGAKENFSDISSMLPIAMLPVSTKTFTAEGLLNNITWYFAVVASDSLGNINTQVVPAAVVPTEQGIHGNVKDEATKTPLSGATVTVQGYPPVSTNSEGYFHRAGLPDGSYTVTFTAPGYESKTVTVEVRLGLMTLIDIGLNKVVVAPPVPQGVQATPGDGSVTINWEPVSYANLSGYNVYRYVSPGDQHPVRINPDTITSDFYVDMGLQNGTTYYYTVTSIDQEGLESEPSAMVSATPVSLPPEPPSGLDATLNQDLTITLTWTPSPTDGVTKYNVYWDAGTGTVDYTQPLASVDGTVSSWTSQALEQGHTYRFGVRSEKAGLEETNTDVVVLISVPPPSNAYKGPRAVITRPKAGKRVAGNRLNVKARLIEGQPSSTGYVLFQYRAVGTQDWTIIPTAVVPHPNPDPTYPYMVHWNVVDLPEGDYEIRAVASDLLGNMDPNPQAITVVIDHHRPDWKEEKDEKVEHRIKKYIKKGQEEHVSFCPYFEEDDYEVIVPKDAPYVDTELIIEVPTKEEIRQKVHGLNSVDRFLRLAMGSGQSSFEPGKEVVIVIPYLDADSDDVIDGTGVSVDDLRLLWYDPATGAWSDTGIIGFSVDKVHKRVTAKTNHFTDFGLFGPASNGNGAKDTDGDGMPDAWEISYGLDPNNPSDAGLDADGDGYTNYQEYLAGTNPLMNDSAPSQDARPVPVTDGPWFWLTLCAGAYLLLRQGRQHILKRLQ